MNEFEVHKSNNGRNKYTALISPDTWNEAHPRNKIDSVKTVRFGGIKEDGTPYEQYEDKFGLYSNYDHKDKKRRKNYRNRHTGITMKRPEDNIEVPAYQYKYSPAWFSYHYLW